VGVPDRVLARRGPLEPEELELVRQHAVLGARLLAPFGEAAAFVRHHHERPDGRGYPDGLKGHEIPVGAAIIGAAEAFDAMTHARPYRPSRSRREALEEVRALRGAQFDADVADALLALPLAGSHA
jgi:HD-GYP domain-containing protein (c-di-GMP phosphodiesterase class II)